MPPAACRLLADQVLLCWGDLAAFFASAVSSMEDQQQGGPPHQSFKPPKMTNRQALDLRKQAVLGHAATHHHHLDAVHEDVMDSSVAECSRLSLESNRSDAGSSAAPGLRHRITLGSWDAYWDSRQQVEVPGRYALPKSAYTAMRGPCACTPTASCRV